MFAEKIMSKVYKKAELIEFDEKSKLVFFSDCHRGNNSWADSFAHNNNIFFEALNYYNKKKFTYIELGDGDELFKNKHFSEIRQAHKHIFWMMKNFFKENRLHMLWGNHDIERKSRNIVKKTIYKYYNERGGKYEPLFEGIRLHEGLILKHKNKNLKIFLIHGHQVDFINYYIWRLGRFFVRHIWKHLDLLGFKDPTDPAKNFKKKDKIDKKIIKWVKDNKQMVIAGHTHRSIMPAAESLPYFNDGSCIHPRCITGIEIVNDTISLIKWSIRTKDNGILHVCREILAGPEKLENYKFK